GLRSPLLDPVHEADSLKDVTNASVGHSAPVALLLREGHTVVGENRVDTVREHIDHLPQKLWAIDLGCSVIKGYVSKLGDPTDGDKHVLLAAGKLHLGAVDMHKAQGSVLELTAPLALLPRG